jgi:excisionase family DNA binding protein
MSAQLDEPVAFTLTDAGWAATRRIVLSDEAAAVLGVHPDAVSAAARRGDLRGEKVGRVWMFDRDAVRAYAARQERRRAQRRLRHVPAQPLLRQVELRGGFRALGVASKSAEEKALERARRAGSLTTDAADRLAVRLLGCTPGEVWPGL